MSFLDGFLKISENMAEKAHLEATTSFQDAVPGTELRSDAETGQHKVKSGRTQNVQNEDRQFKKELKVKYDTSRSVRR